jgi:hypothetical protein
MDKEKKQTYGEDEIIQYKRLRLPKRRLAAGLARRVLDGPRRK